MRALQKHLRPVTLVADVSKRAVCRGATQNMTAPSQLADAYYLAAEWHDKQAAACRDIANDEPRLAKDIRDRAAQAAIHHDASAAGLRLAATQIRRAATAH